MKKIRLTIDFEVDNEAFYIVDHGGNQTRELATLASLTAHAPLKLGRLAVKESGKGYPYLVATVVKAEIVS